MSVPLTVAYDPGRQRLHAAALALPGTGFAVPPVGIFSTDLVSSTGSFGPNAGSEKAFDGSTSTFAQTSAIGGTMTFTHQRHLAATLVQQHHLDRAHLVNRAQVDRAHQLVSVGAKRPPPKYLETSEYPKSMYFET